MILSLVHIYRTNKENKFRVRHQSFVPPTHTHTNTLLLPGW